MSKQSDRRDEIFYILQDVRLSNLSEYEATVKLHELGCVIKVDKKLPASRANEGLRSVNWDDGYRHAEARYKLAGYVAVEPLIECCPKCGKEPHLCKCPTINRGSFAKYVEPIIEEKPCD